MAKFRQISSHWLRERKETAQKVKQQPSISFRRLHQVKLFRYREKWFSWCNQVLRAGLLAGAVAVAWPQTITFILFLPQKVFAVLEL